MNGPKNIVVCCDGTGNEYGAKNTNVVKLFRVIKRDYVNQIAYYDPGVGTLSAMWALTKLAKAYSKAIGLAFAAGLTKHIEDAYSYLMQNYQEGDRVFLFGFSRGAYTVRALAGMLHGVGLLEKGSENLIPYASKVFKHERDRAICNGFKTTYSRECKPHFIGVWDTVSSVGWIYNQVKMPYTANNPDIQVIRHALSIDERRCFYRQNSFHQPKDAQNMQEVWFAGVHSDIGGGYPEAESGLSKVTFQWMVEAAKEFNLQVDDNEYQRVLGAFQGSQQVAPGLVVPPSDRFVPPNHKAELHHSLHGPWWILEFLPHHTWNTRRQPPKKYWRLPRGRTRYVPDGSLVHHSVRDRMTDLPDYRPGNLLKAHNTTYI